MIGLATRQKLHAALHAEIHGDVPHLPQEEDAAYAFRHGRASDKLKHEEFALPNRPFMPNFANADSLGTPGEAARDRATRIEGIYSKVFAIGVALILALTAIGFVNTPAPKQPRPPDTQIQYGKKAARLVAGTSIYELDRQGCLIGMHKSAAGIIRNTTVSTHC